MPFLYPNQQCQSIEGNTFLKLAESFMHLFDICTLLAVTDVPRSQQPARITKKTIEHCWNKIYFKGPCTSINKSHQTISKTPRDIGRTDRVLIARTGPLRQFTQRRFKPSNQVVATINSHVIVSSFYFQFLL